MNNGFNGVSQAQAMVAVMTAGFQLMSPMYQGSGNSWNCVAQKDMGLYSVVVDQSGNVWPTPL